MKLGKIVVLLMLGMVSTSTFAARGYYDDPYDQRTKTRSATGANSQFYMGVGVGSMKTDIPSVNTNAISWALFAGTSINRFLSAEVAYTNLGSTDLGGSSYLKGTAYSLNLVGNIPVTQSVSMFAKFGFANTGVYTESGGSAGTTNSLAAPTIGLGIIAAVTRKTDVRISYDNYKFTTNNSATYNADITSVSVVFKF